MGLDWVPLPKPKPEVEREFEDLFAQVFLGAKSPHDSKFKRLVGLQKPISKEKLSEQLMDLPAYTPYETLKVPRVGFDTAADERIKQLYETGELKKDLLSKPLSDVLNDLHGVFVIEALTECDGIPYYISDPGYGAEAFWFRGKFLEFCEDILEPELFKEAWVSKLPKELLVFGQRLQSTASEFAKRQSVEHVLSIRKLDWEDDSSPEAKAHIVSSAAKWCTFWGSRGHGFQAYF